MVNWSTHIRWVHCWTAATWLSLASFATQWRERLWLHVVVAFLEVTVLDWFFWSFLSTILLGWLIPHWPNLIFWHHLELRGAQCPGAPLSTTTGHYPWASTYFVTSAKRPVSPAVSYEKLEPNLCHTVVWPKILVSWLLPFRILNLTRSWRLIGQFSEVSASASYANPIGSKLSQIQAWEWHVV